MGTANRKQEKMIRLSLGNIGSGKTLCEVRELKLNFSKRLTYTNIKTKLDNQIDLKKDMIIKKEFISTTKKRTGEIIDNYKYSLNRDFWENDVKKPINVTIDEAHTILNSRKAMSHVNVIVSDWLSLLRRILGGKGEGYGDLVLITQFPRRLDINAKDMSNQIRWHRYSCFKKCLTCNLGWTETSDDAEQHVYCPRCKTPSLKRLNEEIYILFFTDWLNFEEWRLFNKKKPFKTMRLKNIQKYYNLYDTLQWDDLMTDS